MRKLKEIKLPIKFNEVDEYGDMFVEGCFDASINRKDLDDLDKMLPQMKYFLLEWKGEEGNVDKLFEKYGTHRLHDLTTNQLMGLYKELKSK